MPESSITDCPLTGRPCAYREWLVSEVRQTGEAAARYSATYRRLSFFDRMAEDSPRSVRAGFRKFGAIVRQVLREEPALDCRQGVCGTAVSITQQLGSMCLPEHSSMTFGDPDNLPEPQTTAYGFFNQGD